MENAPLTDEDETASSGKKSRKKKAGDIGFVAAKSERSRSNAAEKAERRWQRAPKTESSEEREASPESDTPIKKPAKAERLTPEPVSEALAPLEALGEEETPFVLQELAQAGKKKVTAEITDGSPEAATAKLAAEEFYIEAEESQDPEAAYQKIMNLLGVTAEKTPEPSQSEESAEDLAETETPAVEEAAEAPPAEAPDEFTDDEIVFARRTAETAAEGKDEAETDDPALTAPSAAGGAGTAAGSGNGGSVRGSGVPPQAPLPPFGPAGPGVPGGPGNVGTGFNPNLIPPLPAAAPNTAERVPEYHDIHPAAAALVGGIVGYLIGRRRGRIKTEKRLLPVQKKLEKQVTGLQWQLQEKETKIRKVAAEQVRSQGAAIAERINQAAEQRLTRREDERQVLRQPAPEAHQLHGTHRRQEQIGHMLVAAEAPPTIRHIKAPLAPEITGAPGAAESRAPEKDAEVPAKAVSKQRVETMQRAELLNISEQIVVGGSNLRQIYETHLIGERGLRRLVAEHMEGGDLKKALRTEIVEREIDFERDPAMRDQSHQAPAAVSSSGKAALDTLLRQAAASLPDSSEEAAFFKARSRFEAAHQAQQHKQRRLIDISLASAIVILISAVMILYLRGN